MMAIATLETQARNHAYPYRGRVPPLVPSVALSVAFSDLIPDPAVALTWQFTVLRSGDRASDISVDWAVVPASSPMPASTFVGGVYPSGTIVIPAGVTSGTGGFQTAAGGRPSVDQFATLALLGPSGCILGNPVSAALRLPGQPIPVQDQLSVTCPDTSWPVDPATHDHLVTVARSNSLGTYLAGTQVRVRLTGTGGNPIVAADISGGLLDSTVTFAAGETSRPFTVSTLPGAAPASDKTGRVEVSAPVGGQLAALGTRVDVAIPHAVTVAPPTGILPPQYTDPNFAGMSAYSKAGLTTPITNKTDLLDAASDLSNNVLCKTKYIELAASFNDTGTLNLPYRGYVDATGKIYPLIIRSVLANIGDRTKFNNLAHFRHIDLNNAVWLWLHGLACEFPLTPDAVDYPYQADVGFAIEMDGSTDCLVTRCWLDAPQNLHSNTAVRPRVGANDFYGTVNADSGWQTQLRFSQRGPSLRQQTRTIRAWVYQNFFGQIRHPHMVWIDANDHSKGKESSGSAAVYAGDGVEPDPPIDLPYPANPYDLNLRESWLFNNFVFADHNFLVYCKAALNIWRNRVVSVANWTDTDDGNPQGNAYHYIAVRGGNVTGKPLGAAGYPTEVAKVCYNSTEGRAGHSDVQGWNLDYEFNDWGGVTFNIFMHCGRAADNTKTLMGGNHLNFRGNKNGAYNIGNSRIDASYLYYGPVLDLTWEYEGEGVAADAPTWKWQSTYTTAGRTCAYSPSGAAVSWGASGLNDVALKVTFPSDTQKIAAAVGQLAKKATTTATRQLTTAHRTADYRDEFTKGKKGIAAGDNNCLVWDYVGTGAGGGGGTEPANYDLVSENCTVWWPYDDMATNLPGSSVRWLAGGGFEVNAANNGAIHSCMNIWHRKKPPTDKCLFTFYLTLLDPVTVAPTGEGVFALFRVRQKGITGFPADPNAWAPADYRPVAPYAYVTPGSDNMVRDRTSGYRHSFVNSANTALNTMQFRIRPSDGGNDGVDNSAALVFDPTVPATIPATGDSFLFVQNVKYKLEYSRDGNTVSCLKTNTADGTTQTWTFVDAKLGAAGQGVDGWCGFNASLGRWFRVEPVPGVAFCSAVP